MSAILGLMLLSAIAYASSLHIFSKEKLPPLLRYLFYTGWEFMLIGIVIGPFALDFFPEFLLRELEPVIHLGFGWVGLLVGTQMRLSDLARVERWHLRVTLYQALFSGLLVMLTVYLPLHYLYKWGAGEAVVAAAVLAASAAVSSPTALALLGKERRFEASARQLLNVISGLDAMVAVVLLALSLTLLRYGLVSFTLGIKYLAQATGTGLLLGFFFRHLPRNKLKDKEQLVLMIGFVFFSAGVGGVLSVSPLVISFIAGVFLANTLPPEDPLYRAASNTERPFYIIMLLLAGLMFVPSPTTFAVALLVVPMRLLGKQYSLNWLTGRGGAPSPFPKNGGLALASQGAMTLVIGFAYLSVESGGMGRSIFSIIALCVMINEMAAPFLIDRVLAVK